MALTEFELPFTNPVLVFAIVLLAILLTPLIFSRFKIPGIVGLILSGVILGPRGLHVLERDTSIILFGTVGLLYIMFMAGLEMDMNDFKKNKNKSLIFGALTFLFPFSIGFFAAYYVLNYSGIASVLLASMFSTHTLIAYPIISKLGITQSRTVAMVIGGTIITDAAVLLILAVITNIKENELSLLFFAKLFLSLGLLVFIILWGVPRLGRWFFRTMESEGHSQYLFVLTIVFLAGFLSHLIGVEPIIGAFLAGLALNQLIPNTSTLMNRIDFIGNSIFIPFFLISVGMLVDLRVLTKGPDALLVALLIIVISFIGKWLAAYATQQLFKYNKTERKLIWGMSSAHAAATIAVVIIGYNLKLLDENVLNGTVLLILVSCLGSSLISERAGRQIAIDDENRIPQGTVKEERILVPISNMENVDRLIDLSLYIATAKSSQPIYPLFVLSNKKSAEEKITQYRTKMVRALKDSGIEKSKEPIFRVDLNVGNGILRVITELQITDVIVGWNGKVTFGKSFGPILDRVVSAANVQVLICRILYPLNTTKRMIVAIPENAERESGFKDLIDTLLQLSRNAGASIVIFSTEHTYKQINDIMLNTTKSQEVTFHPFHRWTDLLTIYKTVEQNDVFIAVQARPYTVSYHESMKRVPKLLTRYFKDSSVIITYPNQA
ncbi:MAG TPA: cation:proton antiporter [Chryseolinea sp.]|nr:cation:proton antiporter [Chryseolinea sp.]